MLLETDVTDDEDGIAGITPLTLPAALANVEVSFRLFVNEGNSFLLVANTETSTFVYDLEGPVAASEPTTFADEPTLLATGPSGSVTVQRIDNRVLLSADDGIFVLGPGGFTPMITTATPTILASNDVDNAIIVREDEGTFVYDDDGTRLFAVPEYFTFLFSDVNFSRGITRDGSAENNFLVHSWRDLFSELGALPRLPSP